MSCVFWVVWPLYSCFAYATVYAMSTLPQWEPTRIIPLKVCLRRANARVKRCHNVLVCLRRHTPGCFWKSGTELLLTRPQSHQHCAKWHTLRRPAGAPASRLQTTPCSLQQHKHPDSKVPIDILQPHQHPGPKVFQRAEGRFWAFNASNMDSFARGLVVSLCTRAYTVPTQSLREAYACSRVPWQKSGETFGSSKSLMALTATSRWKAKNI